MKVFFDTNVFLYAFLDQGVSKKRLAVDLLVKAVREQNGFVSLQVVKEFCNVMLKRSTRSADETIRATQLFGHFNMVSGTMPLVRTAVSYKERYDIQFYDSLLLAAAEASGCDTIYTEDLNDGQIYAGVKAVNPFKAI